MDDVVNANYTIPDYLSYFAKDLIKGLLSKSPTDRIPAKDILNHEFLAKEDSEHSILKYYRLQLSRHSANSKFKACASSKRLKPLRQNIKHARISILENGTTVAEFNDNQGISMEISECGSRVSILMVWSH